ncbi:MAG: aminoglycoside phosphotransferase family protein [bacterium]|nr:aminoglycoside phosphotransferase family protein [bacterium]
MKMIYPKWRELEINPKEISFKKIQLQKIINYLPAGNDVVECKCIYNERSVPLFIKIERSKMADFAAEVKNISLLKNNGYYEKMPPIIEHGIINEKKYIVLEKVNGRRLSEFINKKSYIVRRKNFLEKYGKELAKIHQIPYLKFDVAKQRPINDFPKENFYRKTDAFAENYIKYLRDNKPNIKYNSFIHGDFHYANILWKKEQIVGVLDYEYSGKGLKEQDIAWAIVLRPTQVFMDNWEDVFNFLQGYQKVTTFDKDLLKWCLINAYIHFYLMNIDNENYILKIQKLIALIMKNLPVLY